MPIAYCWFRNFHQTTKKTTINRGIYLTTNLNWCFSTRFLHPSTIPINHTSDRAPCQRHGITSQPPASVDGVKSTIQYMVVSKNTFTPKWMVYMEEPIKMDDLGVPPFKETSTSEWIVISEWTVIFHKLSNSCEKNDWKNQFNWFN